MFYVWQYTLETTRILFTQSLEIIIIIRITLPKPLKITKNQRNGITDVMATDTQNLLIFDIKLVDEIVDFDIVFFEDRLITVKGKLSSVEFCV